MQFLEWLDRHFASNCHYYYADDLGCPLELFPDTLPEPAQSDQRPIQAEGQPSAGDVRRESADWQ